MIIINRHNYEEFFLLYVDNELPTEDRAAVERFLQENPDLTTEMEMLKEAILPDEKVLFSEKELLYNQAEGISLKNYEEYFLLAVDQELSKQENEEVEKFVLKHPELQNEFTLLQQTRLEPEVLEFVGKESLYRSEKERRVIFVNWIRFSAAAAIVALTALAWFLSDTGKPSSTYRDVVNTDEITKPAPDKKTETAKPTRTKSAIPEQAVAVVPKKQPAKIEVISAKIAPVKNVETKRDKSVLASKTVRNQPVQTLPQIRRNNAAVENLEQKRKSFEETIAAAKLPKTNNPAFENEKRVNTTVEAKQTTDVDPTLVKQAVYREIDSQQDDEEKTLYIGSAEINKNKLRGIFKKAASLFDKKNNKNDDERTLKIAGFEIKTK